MIMHKYIWQALLLGIPSRRHVKSLDALQISKTLELNQWAPENVGINGYTHYHAPESVSSLFLL